MIEDETGLAEETAQAMRELASTVTEAPPLRLAPRRGRATRPARQRSWQLWAVPLTTAVAVVALAIALVTIKDLSTTPATHPVAHPAHRATAPTYYVATTTTCGPEQEHCPTPRLVVGDTFTGAKWLPSHRPPAPCSDCVGRRRRPDVRHRHLPQSGRHRRPDASRRRCTCSRSGPARQLPSG